MTYGLMGGLRTLQQPEIATQTTETPKNLIEVIETVVDFGESIVNKLLTLKDTAKEELTGLKDAATQPFHDGGIFDETHLSNRLSLGGAKKGKIFLYQQGISDAITKIDLYTEQIQSHISDLIKVIRKDGVPLLTSKNLTQLKSDTVMSHIAGIYHGTIGLMEIAEDDILGSDDDEYTWTEFGTDILLTDAESEAMKNHHDKVLISLTNRYESILQEKLVVDIHTLINNGKKIQKSFNKYFPGMSYMDFENGMKSSLEIPIKIASTGLDNIYQQSKAGSQNKDGEVV